MTKEELSKFFAVKNGEIDYSICLEDNILAYLLERGVFSVFFDGKSCRLEVFLSDVFAWGCADSEPVATEKELIDLFLKVINSKNPSTGCIKWACIKRNEKPQEPVQKLIKERGEWDDDFENLPDNQYDMLANK